MTWLRDVVRALQNLGGEARWTDIVEETYRIRAEKNDYISYFSQLRINFVLNENRDGNGRDIFTKVARGVYKLKTPQWQKTIEEIPLEEFLKVEEEQFLTDIQSKLRLIDDFLALISNKDSNETQAGEFLKESPWIFGFEYLKAIPEERIGLNGRTDFLLEGVGGKFDIIELKSPRDAVFIKSDNQDFYRWSAVCKDAVSQMMNYLSKYDKYYLFQREETKRDVLYPNGIIVIGRKESKYLQALAIHNNFLHRIKIVTYDHILESCRQSLKSVEEESQHEK